MHMWVVGVREVAHIPNITFPQEGTLVTFLSLVKWHRHPLYVHQGILKKHPQIPVY